LALLGVGHAAHLNGGIRAASREYAVQRVIKVQGGLKAYSATPDMLETTPGAKECPFCSDKHRLRRHGHYRRFALLPCEQGPVRVWVRRLLCSRTGKTVSLLPDFCLPRRQHGPAIVGTFLSGYAEGGTLLASLRAARPDAPGHAVAQSLRKGFLGRAGPIRAYLARLRARAIVPPVTTCRRRREVAALVAGLCHGFAAAAQAFVHHGVGLHAMAQIGLA
jgi:hypothetical protein